MVEFFSQEWLDQYKELLNDNAAYKEAAHDWEGDFIFEVTDIEDGPNRAYIDLWHGDCREARLAKPDDSAEYSYSGPMKNWMLLLDKKIDPIKGLMSKKFKLKGDMGKVMRYTKAAQELVATAAKVPTEFPE